MRRILLGVLVAWSLSGSAVSLAATPEEAANGLSSQIMSPFCPGVTLHECPSKEAIRLRDRIEVWFADGMSEAAVMQRLEEEYGSGIRAVPPTEGPGRLGWILPGAAIALALGAGVWLTRKWTHSPDPEEDAGDPLTDRDRARIDDELAVLRGHQ